MTVEETYLKGCFVIQPDLYKDGRGYFYESFNLKAFKEKVTPSITFVQDNQSMSSKGVLRGLHFQTGDHAQAKLVRVIQGKVLDVVVDIRKESPTFGQHFSLILDSQEHKQLFIPKGFAHGFLVLENQTIFSYKCDNYYNKQSESGIAYNDETLNIDWGFQEKDLILSQKDKTLQTFKTFCHDL